MMKLSVVVINYNGIGTVLDTIASIYELAGVDPDIIVIDDASEDGSPAAIRQKYPEVRIYEQERNTKELNRLRNLGMSLATTDKILLTDNDVEFDPQCVAEMLRVMVEHNDVAACLPRLMYLDDSSRIFHAGGLTHFIGSTIAPHRDQSKAYLNDQPELGVGGGIALFDREILSRVGDFDEGYSLAWGCDAELHQRFLLAGYKCLYVPTAVCLHEYKPLDPSRYYRARGQIANRWRFVLTHYSARTLALLTPAMAFYELVQAAFYAAKGIPLLYVQGTVDAIRQVPATMRRRKAVQALRAVADKEVLFTGPIYLRVREEGVRSWLVSAAVGGVSVLLSAYWWLIQPVLPNSCSQSDAEEGTERSIT